MPCNYSIGPCISGICVSVLTLCGPVVASSKLERDFRDVPASSRQLIGPLLWIHGDESKARIEEMVQKVAEGGNGTFTVESRPHKDWIGPGWWRDLKICAAAARKHGLTMWIFDEEFFPSGLVGGRVPEAYRNKLMVASEAAVAGNTQYSGAGYGTNLIAVIAGRVTPDGVDSDSLADLTSLVRGDTLTWTAPAGEWKVMRFAWRVEPGLIDGASKYCVDWYIRTVYQPHYDHLKADFGSTIKGFFFDEPMFDGDWGTEVIPTLQGMGVDWMKAVVAYKFSLAGPDQAIYRYQYHDAYAEALGRTLYGALQSWCRERGVALTGHFIEHSWQSLSMRYAGGDQFKLQKYCGTGGIDLVNHQLYPGWRSGMGPATDPELVYQTPKLASSIAHVYNMKDDITMCEFFGAYGQEVTYPQMKWLTDWACARGVNYNITHSFNCRAPYDCDCPPFFWMGDLEPRWPLYKVYADYTARLGDMLSGGRHVCPIALLWVGASKLVGNAVVPEDMTTAIQDSCYDCDWLPYELLEKGVEIRDGELRLHGESYKVLIVPPVEVIPHPTLVRVKEFFDKGGIVIGHGFLPSRSATVGKTPDDIAGLVGQIWGEAKPDLNPCRKSAAGGRSYFMPEKPAPEEVYKVLAGDAKVFPVVEVLKGDTNRWLHVLHRVKDEQDIYLVCNQNWQDQPRQFTLRLRSRGYPECWDAMRGEITSVPFKRTEDTLDIDITLQPAESVMIVMNPEMRDLPARLDGSVGPIRTVAISGSAAPARPGAATDTLTGQHWIWYPNSWQNGLAYFRGHMSIPEGRQVRSARYLFASTDEYTTFLNGKQVDANMGREIWRGPTAMDVTDVVVSGDNVFAVEANNSGLIPKANGLIGYCIVELDNGEKIDFRVDLGWKATGTRTDGWQERAFDDSKWGPTIPIYYFGYKGSGETFTGTCELPGSIDLEGARICLEADSIGPEEAASITINGKPAGGFICRPLRADVTRFLKKGTNSVVVTPFAPKGLRLAVYAPPLAPDLRTAQ